MRVRMCITVYLKNHYIDLFEILHNESFNTAGCSQLYHNPEIQIVFEKLISKCEELDNFIQKPKEIVKIQFGINDSKYMKYIT